MTYRLAYRRRPSLRIVPYLLMIGGAIAGCNGSPPPEAMKGVEARAARKLRTQVIGEWISGADKSLALIVLEVTLRGGLRERRAYLQGPSGARYLGPLQRQLADAPLESLFFETNGTRFAILWVEPSVRGTVKSVTLGRPQQRPTDDSMNTLRSAAAANSVAIVPVRPNEKALWAHVREILIYAGGLRFSWKRTYDPPLPVDALFRSVALP